ncbi:MAG: hypothetical protein IJS22_07845 [Lachnospiraceae bacterium]|nr:hypothetical protein [Lachnospiraceae bacterium]
MDLLHEIAAVDSRIEYLGRELRHIKALMREAGVAHCGYGGEAPSFADADVREIREYYEEIRRLVKEESRMKKVLYLMIRDLPRREMIDVITHIYVDGMSISETAELMEYSTRQIKRLIDNARSILSINYENYAYMSNVRKRVHTERPHKKAVFG